MRVIIKYGLFKFKGQISVFVGLLQSELSDFIYHEWGEVYC